MIFDMAEYEENESLLSPSYLKEIPVLCEDLESPPTPSPDVQQMWMCIQFQAKVQSTLSNVYTRILAERKTSNLNAEIVGSAYTRITIITLLHVSKIIILTLILRGRLICE